MGPNADSASHCIEMQRYNSHPSKRILSQPQTDANISLMPAAVDRWTKHDAKAQFPGNKVYNNKSGPTNETISNAA